MLLNTAVSKADDPVLMAGAFRHAVAGGRLAHRAGRIPARRRAEPSSPQMGLVGVVILAARRTLPGRLLVVTDRRQAQKSLSDLADELFAAGLRWLWLRDRDLPADERRTLAHDLARRRRPARRDADDRG